MKGNNILKDLPDLIEKGILTKNTADKIEEYYRKDSKVSKDKLQIVLAVLGALLVGLGILLILAHNWDSLPKIVKVIFAFIPLVASHILIGYVLIKRHSDKKWVESVAVFNYVAIAISISLVSQIYHINGEFDDFMLTWMLLALPVVYILKSSMLSLLYIAGITVFAANTAVLDYPFIRKPLLYIPLFLLILPYYYELLKKNKFNNFTFFHNWFVPLYIAFSLPILIRNSLEWIPLMFLGLFAIIYIIGKTDNLRYHNYLKNAYLLIGVIGTLILLYIVSFEDYWYSVITKNPFDEPGISFLLVVTALLVVLILTGKSIVAKKAGFDPVEWGYTLFVILFVLSVKADLNPVIPEVIINLLILFIGVSYIVRGEKKNDLILLNLGLLIISVLIIVRFFDYDISFLIRGILFILIGICFFIANYILVKRKKILEL